jgi:hypothetical protein
VRVALGCVVLVVGCAHAPPPTPAPAPAPTHSLRELVVATCALADRVATDRTRSSGARFAEWARWLASNADDVVRLGPIGESWEVHRYAALSQAAARMGIECSAIDTLETGLPEIDPAYVASEMDDLRRACVIASDPSITRLEWATRIEVMWGRELAELTNPDVIFALLGGGCAAGYDQDELAAYVRRVMPAAWSCPALVETARTSEAQYEAALQEQRAREATAAAADAELPP